VGIGNLGGIGGQGHRTGTGRAAGEWANDAFYSVAGRVSVRRNPSGCSRTRKAGLT
jgi:hypothetical protein